MNGSIKNTICRISAEKLDIGAITDWLRNLRGAPYVPYSNYDVGAIIRMQAGGKQLYVAGVNVEYPEQRISTHGEEGAIAALVTATGKGAVIDEAWVMAAPAHLRLPTSDPRADKGGSCCGNCRQRLSGFAAPDTQIHTIALNGNITTMTMKDLLPDSFSFRDFLENGPDAHKTRPPLDQSMIENRLYREGAALDDSAIAAWLDDLEPWDYASGQGEKVIVGFEGGFYSACVRIEDAAFTGTSAIQGALAIACARHGRRTVSQIWYKGVAATAQPFIKAGAAQTLASFAVAPDKTPIHFM